MTLTTKHTVLIRTGTTFAPVTLGTLVMGSRQLQAEAPAVSTIKSVPSVPVGRLQTRFNVPVVTLPYVQRRPVVMPVAARVATLPMVSSVSTLTSAQLGTIIVMSTRNASITWAASSAIAMTGENFE